MSPAGTPGGPDLNGYDVQAIDGPIGWVDQPNQRTDGRLVIATAPWMSKRKILLLGDAVDRVDHDAHRVYLARTQDQVGKSPEYDPEAFGIDGFRHRARGRYADVCQALPPRM
jgi:hypothetical protein